MVGIGRAMRAEYPNINLQILDIDTLHDNTAKDVVETLLRLELLDLWSKQKSNENLFWSAEPELAIENEYVLVPRLLPHKDANLRYNSSRRLVTREANPQEKSLQLSSTGDSVSIQEISPLCAQTSQLVPTAAVQVSHSIFPFIHIKGVGYAMLVAGTDLSTSEPVFALSQC